jgi:UDP-glucose 4-epimerase
MIMPSGTRVVVTGGAGFIGSHLVDVLMAEENEVIVIDDFSSGRREHLAHHAGNGRLRVVVGDIRDLELIEAHFRGAQYVFHLAARSVRLSLRQPSTVHEVNALGTYCVLRAATAAGVARLLYCSSSEVHGSAVEVPLPEDCEFRPETMYGAAKLAGEFYAQVFHRSGWLETVVARPHNAYGPRAHYEAERGELIPRLVLRALAGLPALIFGDGLQTRDFTYVEETARYLAALATAPAAGRTFNVCRGQEVSIREVASRIAALTGLAAPPVFLPERPHDVRRLCGDPSRLRRTLGSSPVVDIADGLGRTVDWYRRNVTVTPQLLARIAPENWTVQPAEHWVKA